MNKKIVIIGAGIAGLSTGCYAQMNKFQSEIYEMHSVPGGVCTSWKRGDYLFDHCLHWVIGSNKGTTLYPIFKELGIADSIEFLYTDIFRVISANGLKMTVYTDINKFESELLRLFPEEKRGLKKYINLLKKYTEFNPPMDGDFGNFKFKDFIKLLPFMPSFMKLKKITVEEFFDSLFSNNLLKEMLYRIFPVKKLPALMAIMPLSFMHRKEAGYPLGGSLNFAQEIEKKYTDLGGKVHYNCRVKKIIVKDCCTIGIELDNGKFIPADIVISACDGRTTLFEMLEGNYLPKRIKEFYHKPQLWPPIISISLGVKRDFSGMPAIYDFKLREPIIINGKEIYWSGFFHYCHDQDFAPKGKSVLKTQIESDYFYWKELYEKDRDGYYREKERILKSYINVLEEILPGIKEDIEIADIATPVTWERYTGNWQGSYEGWLPTVDTFGVILPKKLPGLRNFYMIGQWVFPGGGVPMCMAQGKNLINQVIKEIAR
ncbi:MAG TPA: NAD(P)/FAD-dependent oxidoreductase [Halanaerobiales bacterium]|nr:NAD(P)/FAD-dependent oxidoreductase [Halanaerobiales bacterium]HPZ62921.1 NAD(P)/FAD-dependent oxidoreductase [Halanaerobiales bacterium]HQD04174.1 NAD(P)/FAD-dependent oxidoreductase [Halanaerobiales bacterium]